MMESIETGKAPSYTELMERFGDEIPMEQALEKTHKEQRKHQGLVAIGSVLASKDVYGYKDLRETSHGLDFVGDPDTVREMNSEYGESWFYNGGYVFSTDEDEEWMMAVIPCNEEAFEDSELKDFSIDAYNVMSPETVSTSEGDINAVSPELGYVSKLRRYMMKKKNGKNFKKGDMIDIANISLNNYEKDFMDYETVDKLVDQFIGEKPDTDELLHDIIESIESENVDLDSHEIEGSLREIRSCLDHSY